MKITKILTVVLAVAFVVTISGCNSGGGHGAILKTDEWCFGCVDVDPVGVNINDKNTTELLTVIREEELQDTVVKLTKGKKPVIKTPADIAIATGTSSMMGTAFGPRPKITRARK